MITEEQRQWLRTRLLEQRDEVVRDLERQRAEDRSAVPAREGLDDLADRAGVELERAFEHRRENDDTHLLQKIKRALERLESGQHEICEWCQAPLLWERLQARPWTTLCHSCQQAKENGSTVETPR